MTTEPTATTKWINAPQRLQHFTDAANMARLYRAIYEQCRLVMEMHVRYQDRRDPEFNAAIDTLFTAEERAELSVMKGQIQALVDDWENNHSDAVGKPKTQTEEPIGLP